MHDLVFPEKTEDYTSWRQFNEKPSIIPGCPDARPGGPISTLRNRLLIMAQASILDQAWGGDIALPTREEVGAIPMPGLPNLEPPSPRTQF